MLPIRTHINQRADQDVDSPISTKFDVADRRGGGLGTVESLRGMLLGLPFNLGVNRVEMVQHSGPS